MLSRVPIPAEEAFEMPFCNLQNPRILFRLANANKDKKARQYYFSQIDEQPSRVSFFAFLEFIV